MSDSLRDTIEPKSDQLNADDLIGTTKTITVSSVKRGSTEQPVVVHYEGENGRPYKPCKSMRRLLIWAWGEDGQEWSGRSMTLYHDPEVKFGGVKVGGIRISHMSHIDQEMSVPLTVTKGKRALYNVKVLQAPRQATEKPKEAPQDDRVGEMRALYADTKKCTTERELDELWYSEETVSLLKWAEEHAPDIKEKCIDARGQMIEKLEAQND